MKRLIVFILLLLMLCGLEYSFMDGLNLKSLFFGADVEIYLSNTDDLAKVDFIKNGMGGIIVCGIEKIDNYMNLHNITGLTIKISNMAIDDVLLKLNPRNFKTDGDYIYGYVPKMSWFGDINGNNFQLAKYEDNILIGFPILLGSY